MDTTVNRLMKCGLALAIIPAALFFPAVAFLAVCPPSYGKSAMTILAIGFIGSWATAIALSLRALILHSRDRATIVAAWCGITISAVGLAYAVYGIAK
jgi:hypothetical protein